MKKIKVNLDKKYSLPYQKRNKQFKGNNGNNIFIPETCRAYSYNHWRYVDVVRGLVVFNDYNYSKTTCGHQSTMRRLLKELGVKIHVVVSARTGLQSDGWQKEEATRLYNTLFLARYKFKYKKLRASVVKDLKALVKQTERDLKAAAKVGVKLSKVDQKAAHTDVVGRYEAELLDKRNVAAEYRRKRKEHLAANAKELNSLESLDLLNNYDNLNHMGAL